MKADIREHLSRRVLVLDGAMGTMIQTFGLTEQDYRGDVLRDHPVPLKGCNDVLPLTRPDVVAQIHRRYLEAGADIITTDSFNANRISMRDYALDGMVREMCVAAARTARREADAFNTRNPFSPRWVAGSVGPTSKTASMSTSVDDPGARDVDFAMLYDAFTEQIEGLLDGGADIIIFETFFDTLNCKAAIAALDAVRERRGACVPVIVSGTLTAGGRMLAGQTVEAFCASVSHIEPLAVGLNCSFGASQMYPYIRRISECVSCAVSVYPNAGLPNLSGGYDQTPEMMAADIQGFLNEGLVNIVGGCCGTTPLHIARIAAVARKASPRKLPEPAGGMLLSGLDVLRIDSNSNFINIGERTNVAGSAKFARLIREGDFDQALSVARDQIRAGASVIDICFDDAMIDAPAAMRRFLNLAASDAEIAAVPFMIDSSSWSTVEQGLQCVQGRCIVNSISLKEGEEAFRRKAALVRRYGAAAVVMLFDERGQADTYERKTEVAARSYSILRETGFCEGDIIFDPNVLAVATGMPEHDRYALDFIRAARWIREQFPGVGISGGVSNLSFSFRGINPVRQAMHSVFLYHAIAAGMNMGIVNPAMLTLYDDIEPKLLELCEDVILARREDASERLTEYASAVRDKMAQQAGQPASESEKPEWRSLPVSERISWAMVKGETRYIADDAMEAFKAMGDPIAVINSCFMPAMAKVGEMFGSGRMFLPQVVKSARVMKTGVAALMPLMERRSEGSSAGKVVLATVKGDVHDIGKNILSVVLSCNGFEVQDLGVMAEAETIIETARRENARFIALSGLITPSLEEMVRVVSRMEQLSMDIPVLIGGATTTALHTAVKIAPCYSGLTVYGRDASETASLAVSLTGPGAGNAAFNIRESQRRLRESYGLRCEASPLSPMRLEGAYRRDPATSVRPLWTGVRHVDVGDIGLLSEYIDWNYFLSCWSVKGRWPEILDDPAKGPVASQLMEDARNMLLRLQRSRALTLTAVVGIFPARSSGNDIVIARPDGSEIVLAQLRSQTQNEAPCLADYVAERDDWICAFTVSAGNGLAGFCTALRAEGDEYGAIMAKLLADRLTEAMAERLHYLVRTEFWGFDRECSADPADMIRGNYRGLRMAFGYPACPDHSLKRDVFGLLGLAGTTPLSLTENFMIDPGETVMGIILDDPNIRYFSVGLIGDDQLADYAARRGMSPERIADLIPNNIR